LVGYIASVCNASPLSSKNLAVVRQDTTGKGFVENVELAEGKINKQSNVSFNFKWPLVEMTSNTVNKEVFIITYPDGYPGPVLYKLNQDLSLIYAWEKVQFSFFDLQYSPKQSTLYGIYVSSTYGRVLSNFTANQIEDSVAVNQLFTLPYMWYVNASSFDAQNNRYFALINNFPGFENSTLDQQLIVADFNTEVKEGPIDNSLVSVLPIKSNGVLVQFVSYSSKLNKLFCAGTFHDKSGTTAVVTIMDIGTAAATTEPHQLVLSVDAVAVGPLIVDDDEGRVLVFVKTIENSKPLWTLWSMPYSHIFERMSTVLATYSGDDFNFFAGASLINA